MIYNNVKGIYKMERKEFMKRFGDNYYDYDNIKDIIIVEDGEMENTEYPFSVYVRMKGELHYTSFASEEFSMEEVMKMYEEE